MVKMHQNYMEFCSPVIQRKNAVFSIWLSLEKRGKLETTQKKSPHSYLGPRFLPTPNTIKEVNSHAVFCINKIKIRLQ